MFNPTPQETKSGLDEAIDDIYREMANLKPDTDSYSAMADQLVKLYSLKALESAPRISPDTLAIVVGNLVGIILIVGYERTNVVTSKALNFVLKLR